MIDLRRALPMGLAVALLTVHVGAQQTQPPAGQQPPTQPPAPPATSSAAASKCPAPVPPATLPDRIFSGTMGMLLHPVFSTKVADFEMFLGYLRDALAKSTDPVVRQQAKGWKIYVDTTPGPNNDVIYVFLLDPAVPCVDYSLGPIIAASIADRGERDRVWHLYTNSVRTGGTLMDLVPPGQAPVKQAAPATAPSATQKPPAAQTPAPPPAVPLDANPNRPPQNVK
jgi:hypothetical protein